MQVAYQVRDDAFAGTPPLEALRLLVSDAATVGEDGGEEKVIMINDISRAFFEAPMKRALRIELPEESKTEEDRKNDNVGLLVQSLYGTRDAANNFQDEVAKVMRAAGFSRGRYNPCTYWHAKKGLKTMVHGDDFVTSGPRNEMK